MSRIPEEIIKQIMEQNDIVDVVSEYVNLKRSGRGYMGVCPFHNDKGPSLSVSPDKQLFHCFGCGAAGNVVGFIMKIRNIEYLDALIYLADRVGINVEFTETDDDTHKFKERLYRANIEAARYFYGNLLKNSNALNYLYSRNINNKIINRFGLGYSLNEWDNLIKYLKSKGFTNEELITAGLVVNSDKGIYDRFRNRIMFPIFDIKGRVVAFGGRVCDDSKPKYLNTSETPIFEKGKNLYGLNYVIKNRTEDSIIIVEGYMDCIKLHQYGLDNVVASLGTALTLEQAKLLKRYTKNIYICYDADAAGQAATLRGLEILESVGLNVRVIMIPRGKDPDEYVNTYGIDAFKQLVEKSLFITDYRIIKAKEGKNIKDYLHKTQYINEVVQILSKMKDEVLVQYYAEQVSNETGIPLNIIIDKVNKANLSNNKKYNNFNLRNNITENTSNLIPAYKKAEALILGLATYKREVFEYIKDRIDVEEFITNVYKQVAKHIFNSLDSDMQVNQNELLVNFQDKDDIQDVSRIFCNEFKEDDNLFKMADDAIKVIKKYNIEDKINSIKNKIKIYEENNQFDESIKLMQELVILQKQLSQM